ncbi:hypothetical protein Pcinc_013456 [Petrolisthes cinctipes]|uniref:Uncharacterized protein n=1 Tax=Petrolisthes cinctipes TaxID=88211 RepID=A0AAE1FZ18_PETCI|nr:hypothetical protein Pcinc_013456 [Petrolisthes cinctipes]
MPSLEVESVVEGEAALVVVVVVEVEGEAALVVVVVVEVEGEAALVVVVVEVEVEGEAALVVVVVEVEAMAAVAWPSKSKILLTPLRVSCFGLGGTDSSWSSSSSSS